MSFQHGNRGGLPCVCLADSRLKVDEGLYSEFEFELVTIKRDYHQLLSVASQN